MRNRQTLYLDTIIDFQHCKQVSQKHIYKQKSAQPTNYELGYEINREFERDGQVEGIIQKKMHPVFIIVCSAAIQMTDRKSST